MTEKTRRTRAWPVKKLSFQDEKGLTGFGRSRSGTRWAEPSFPDKTDSHPWGGRLFMNFVKQMDAHLRLENTPAEASLP